MRSDWLSSRAIKGGGECRSYWWMGTIGGRGCIGSGGGGFSRGCIDSGGYWRLGVIGGWGLLEVRGVLEVKGIGSRGLL